MVSTAGERGNNRETLHPLAPFVTCAFSAKQETCEPLPHEAAFEPFLKKVNQK